MLVFIPTIVAVIIGLSYNLEYAGTPPGPLVGAAAASAYCLCSYLLSAFFTRVALRGVTPDSRPPNLAQRRSFYQRLYWLVLIGGYAALIYAVHWPAILPAEWSGVPLAGEFFTLAPYLIAMFLGLIPAYRGVSAVRATGWKLGEYLWFNFRQNFLVLVPVLFFSLVEDLAETVTDVGLLTEVYPLASTGALSLLFLLLFLVSPLFLRYLMPARVLEEGPLKQRLDALSEKVGVKTTRIYVWNTGAGRIMNAAVVGPSRFLRYIFLTDALTSAMDEDEIESVFAHELSHVVHSHLQVYMMMVFTLLFLTTLFVEEIEAGVLWAAGGSGVGENTAALVASAVALVGLGWLAFGRLWRAFEQQADLSGVMITGNIPVFARALEKIAYLSGNLRNVKGWLHPSVARRVEFLLAVHADPKKGTRFLKKLLAVILVITLVFLVTLVFFVANLGWELAMPMEVKLERTADYYFETVQPDELENTLLRIQREVSSLRASELSNQYALGFRDRELPNLYLRFKIEKKALSPD